MADINNEDLEFIDDDKLEFFPKDLVKDDEFEDEDDEFEYEDGVERYIEFPRRPPTGQLRGKRYKPGHYRVFDEHSSTTWTVHRDPEKMSEWVARSAINDHNVELRSTTKRNIIQQIDYYLSS